MNHAEAAHVLATMAAPHPWDVTDDQAEVWYQAALERCDYELGLAVAIRLVETSERFPTPALFNGTLAAVKRERYTAEIAARQAAEVGSLALTGPGVETAQQQKARFVAMWRESIAKAKAKGEHNHKGGPDRPCPICGGFNPRWNRRPGDVAARR